MRSLKGECLDRMIFFGETSFRRATAEFLSHDHGERNHQGLANRLIVGGEEATRAPGPIECRQRLGGILQYYYRATAQSHRLPKCPVMAGVLGHGSTSSKAPRLCGSAHSCPGSVENRLLEPAQFAISSRVGLRSYSFTIRQAASLHHEPRYCVLTMNN